jgi:hypothetical protein
MLRLPRSRSSTRVAVVLVLAASTTQVVAQQPSLGVESTLTAAPFKDQVGRRVTYVCPPTEVPADVSVWGSDVYTFDSSVCQAAIHAGVLQAGRAGVVTFTMSPGAAVIRSTTRNGVTTKAYAAYQSTFRFDDSREPARIDGGTTLRLPATFTDAIAVVCPPMGDYPYPLWGTDVYADDSSICAAAVHANVITAATGGPVTVQPAGRQPTFQGSARNGLTSQPYGAYETSFRVAAQPGTSTSALTGGGGTRPGASGGSSPFVRPPPVAQTGAAPTTTGAVNVPAPPVAGTPTPQVLAPAPPLVGSTAVSTLAPAPPVAAVQQQPLPANAGRYRVIMLGADVTTPTKDIRDNADGIGDEIYGAAVAMVWDRRTNIVQQPILTNTVEYGDVNAIRKAASRIQAGLGGPGGGLTAGSVVPDRFTATPTTLVGQPSSNQFPLLVWDGVLTDGIDALVVVPSLWERDSTNPGFADYQRRWRAASSQTASLLSLYVPLPGVTANEQAITPPQPQQYSLAEIILHIADRPLGLVPTPLIVPYRERFVVITREKLGGLAPGDATHVSIKYAEPTADPVLGADYTLSLRIERTQ